ncbi:TolC family protein [Carboxylicivirga sediminis]|uniref:TolC family protein n=1 Tax=Carboxylicivirga sediminis TaxID=2006564 RepID=A0A941F9S9_9BACT|nr:TolC family protein [Carboxylicivirga sediminis]MBR8537670.1 TolC family protein [Carboxylicivirga sediminis]
MKRLLILNLLLVSIHLAGQNSIPQLIEQVELNNLMLKSLRAQTDALIMGNKTGMNPSNPEVEYIYQWGNTSQLGNKQEFHVRQSFDFPTAYRYRRQMRENLNEQAEMQYLHAYNRVMLSAQQILYRLIYQNALEEEFQKRLKHAEQIAKAYQLKFDEGDANILELNKANINLLNARNALARIQSDKQLQEEQLQQINGGIAIEFNTKFWPLAQLPENYDDWFNANADIIPVLGSLQDGLEANRYNEKLNKAMSLPKLTGGYSAETGAVDKFRGVNVGLTIPLWENKNTVKEARLTTLALENQMADTRLQLYHGLKAIYLKAGNMQAVAADYRSAMDALNNTELLQIALENGEISILEYMMELGIYYEAVENALNAELDYYLSVAQMNAFQIN